MLWQVYNRLDPVSLENLLTEVTFAPTFFSLNIFDTIFFRMFISQEQQSFTKGSHESLIISNK